MSEEFLADLTGFVARINRFGLWNSFARTLMQLTAPGIPDIYQGDELWNFTLVDPDNRRPVDFTHRAELLDRLPSPGDSIEDLIAGIDDGRLKMYLLRTVLHVRRQYRDLFLKGSYAPLAVGGSTASKSDRLRARVRRRPRDRTRSAMARLDPYGPRTGGASGCTVGRDRGPGAAPVAGTLAMCTERGGACRRRGRLGFSRHSGGYRERC